MNIHFSDRVFFEDLKAATLAKVRVGSHLYGTATENSDQDFLYIYATSTTELHSFITTNHQLQYKENNIDHNFVSLHCFLKNCLNGDSPINFEVIQSDELLHTPLDFITRCKKEFRTYTVIRAYNGFVKRDIKHFSKAQNDAEKFKRMGHIIRGILYTELLLKHTFDFKLANKIFIEQRDEINMNPKTINEELQRLNEVADYQRKSLNNNLEDGTLGYPKNMNVKSATLINGEIQRLMASDIWRIKQDNLQLFDNSYFIKAFENWVSY